jgi:hypothetical protein
VHDWEVDSIFFFNVLYYSTRIGQGGDDRLCWMPLKRRSFKGKSFYKILLPNIDSYFPWKSIWRTRALLMLTFFHLDSFHEKNSHFG